MQDNCWKQQKKNNEDDLKKISQIHEAYIREYHSTYMNLWYHILQTIKTPYNMYKLIPGISDI